MEPTPQPQQPAPPKKNPSPEELYRAWKEGGEDRLGQMLEQMKDEEEEEEEE